MNSVAREKLCDAVARYGRDLSDQPQRCEAVLNDLCKSSHEEIGLLVTIAKIGLAADLRTSSNGVPHYLLLSKHIRSLQSYYFTEQAAKWGIESWALALGIVSETDLTDNSSVGSSVVEDRSMHANDLTESSRSSRASNKLIPAGYIWLGVLVVVASLTTAVVALVMKYKADGRATVAFSARDVAGQALKDLRTAKAKSDQQAKNTIQEKTTALEAAEAEKKRLEGLMPSIHVDNLYIESSYNVIALHIKFHANNLQSVQCVAEAFLSDGVGNELTMWNKPIMKAINFAPNTVNSLHEDLTMYIYPRYIALENGNYTFKLKFRRSNGETIQEISSAVFTYSGNE